MSYQIKAGDWVIARDESCNITFRVTNVIDGILVDKWGGLHGAKLFRKYLGATSPLEAAETGKDAFYRRVGLI